MGKLCNIAMSGMASLSADIITGEMTPSRADVTVSAVAPMTAGSVIGSRVKLSATK